MNQPKSNTSYWQGKLLGTQRRDEANRTLLRTLGWQTLILWECELHRTTIVKRRIKRFLAS